MPNRQAEMNGPGLNDSPGTGGPQASDSERHEFKFAPNRPDGDIWDIALEPLMKREREQCDTWKEEVQNLLILAGLFSAVVTAFVIESYKTLHADPQDTMVFLLSQILARIENGSTTTGSPTSTLFSPLPFVPDKSAERINSFWFISLVLSLATALIGIISLQWLREYQSYANFNSETTLAIFNMRKDGFEKWHVPKVFAALPLLLQGALVLFLAGMVDFSLALGMRVGIPVIIAIALTLVFLLLTTVLPTFQGILYLFHLPTTGSPRDLVPQCPYKSPQSKAFCILATPLHPFFHKVGTLGWQLQLLYRSFINPREGSPSSTVVLTPLGINGSVPQRLLSRKSWSEYDQGWLQLRYHVSQEMFDRMAKPGQSRTPYFSFTPYASHITDFLLCLRRILKSNVSETSMAAAYHCYLQFCLTITSPIDEFLGRPDRLSYDYLSILINNSRNGERSLAGYLDTSRMSQSVYSTALRYQMLSNFPLFPEHPDSVDHYTELQILLKRWMYSDHRKLETSVLLRSVPLPAFVGTRLQYSTVVQLDAVDDDLPLCLPSRGFILFKTPEALVNSYCTIYVSFFSCISKGDQYRDWATSIHMTPEAAELLMEAASLGYHNLIAPTSIAIAGIIIDCLQKYLDIPSDERDADDITYNLLFYAASIYLSGVPKTCLPDPWTPSMWFLYEKLDEARLAVIRYKERVFDVVGPDHAIERRFVECNDFSSSWLDEPQPPRRFTAEWWGFLKVPFVYRAGEEVRLGTGEEEMPITTTTSIPDLPSTSNS